MSATWFPLIFARIACLDCLGGLETGSDSADYQNKMASEGDDPSSRKVSVDYSLLKGFVAGVIFSHFDKRLALGLLVGTLTGAYVQQNYEGIPNVEEKARNLMQSIRETIDKKKWSLGRLSKWEWENMSPQESSTVSSRIPWANEEGNYARSWQTSASKNSSLKTLELAAPGNPDRWLLSRL